MEPSENQLSLSSVQSPRVGFEADLGEAEVRKLLRADPIGY